MVVEFLWGPLDGEVHDIEQPALIVHMRDIRLNDWNFRYNFKQKPDIWARHECILQSFHTYRLDGHFYRYEFDQKQYRV